MLLVHYVDALTLWQQNTSALFTRKFWLQELLIWLLSSEIAKLRKATISFFMSVRMEHLGGFP